MYYENSVVLTEKRYDMASLALAPLLSMLEEMKIDIDTSSLSKKESGLFKELMDLLSSENQDPKALEALIERIETGRFEKEDDPRFPCKEKDLPFPAEVNIERKSELQQTDRRSALSVQPQPLLMPGNRSIETTDEMAQNEIPVQTKMDKAPKEYSTLFHARYTSYTTLKRDVDDAEALHEIRSSRTLGELVRRAEDFGIEVVDFSIETKKEKRPPTATETQKQQMPSSIILQHSERISHSAAEAILEPERKSDKKSDAPAKAVTPLQSLLAESKAEDRKVRKSDISTNSSKNTSKPANDTASLLSSLQALSSPTASGQRRIETAGSVQELSAQKERVEPGMKPEHIPAKPELLQQSLPEIRSNDAEQLTQKIVDAKATLRHFAQSLQEQVQNYKPPFTRMQISLEPKELGSVEVTMVSRGNNLHIQVNSNPTAIGIMATHGGELKNQLVSMGFTEVQMQFGMNQQQQQNRQQRQFHSSIYGQHDELPDFAESLELIVPYYA